MAWPRSSPSSCQMYQSLHIFPPQPSNCSSLLYPTATAMAWWCWTTRFSRAKDTELWGRKEAWQSVVKTFFMAFGAYWCFWEWKQVRLDYLKCVEWHFDKNWEQLLSPMIFGPKTPGSPVISTSIDACVATANELAKAKITFAKRNILLSSGKSCIKSPQKTASERPLYSGCFC